MNNLCTFDAGRVCTGTQICQEKNIRTTPLKENLRLAADVGTFD